MLTRRVFVVLAAIALGALVGTATANITENAGIQTPLPIARPAPAAYGLAIAAVPGGPFSPPALPQFNEVFIARDDLSPCVGFHMTVPAGYWPPPFNVAGTNEFTYRPELDPIQVQLPAVPATNINPMSHWVAVQTVASAMQACRSSFNMVPATGIGQFVIWIDPATAAAGFGPFIGGGPGTLLQNEFYKFHFGN